jgi:hypothetical protein
MKKVRIVIAGAGELGKAVGLVLVEYAAFEATYFIGDRDPDVARRSAEWITKGNTRGRSVHPFVFDVAAGKSTASCAFPEADLIIDCLPFPLAAHVAQLALRRGSAYVSPCASALELNQTPEHTIVSSFPFLFQAGIAPGLVTLLLKDLYEYYRAHCNGKGVDYAGIRVATLPMETCNHSPDAEGRCAFLSCREAILTSNIRSSRKGSLAIWECNEISGDYADYSMMAGGEGNLVSALTDRLRQEAHPMQLRVSRQAKVQATHANQDWLQVQALIEGYTEARAPITLLKSCRIYSAIVGRHWLPSIQVCKAVLLAECAQFLLTRRATGFIFLNQLDAQLLLSGNLIKRFFDITSVPEITYQRPTSSDFTD